MNGNTEQVEKILGSITIPACPAVLMSIVSEIKKEEPDVNVIANLVSNDAALSASVLKLVNSAAFRRSINSIGSIRQAVSVLGFKKVLLAVKTMFLRNSVSTAHPTTKAYLEKFWDKSSHSASACMMLAKMLPGISADDAYTIGLFHDCGIPVLMQRFPEHPFDEVHGNEWEVIHQLENDRLGTNHAIVGNMFARNWGLPAHICQTILQHHDASIFVEPRQLVSNEVRNFVAVLILAEHLVNVLLGVADAKASVRSLSHVRALKHLGLEREEFDEIALDVLNELRQGCN